MYLLMYGTAQRQLDTRRWVTGWQTTGELVESVQMDAGACKRSHL